MTTKLIERLEALAAEYQVECPYKPQKITVALLETIEHLRKLEAENEQIHCLCRELRDWFKAYPVGMFMPLQGDPIKKTGDYDTKEKRNLITRASAGMARHMIERIPEKICEALAACGDES